MLIILKLSDPISILLMVILFIVSLVALWFIIQAVKKDRFQRLEYKGRSGALKKEELDTAIQKQIDLKNQPFTLIRIDLTDYSEIMTNYGISQYDNMLLELQNRLVNILTLGSKLSRYEEGTFLIYFKNKFNELELNEMSKFILDECCKSIVLAGALTISPKINIAIVAYPESGDNLQLLKGNLELTMSICKREGNNYSVIHSAQLNNQESAEYKQYLEIKKAIEEKQFVLYYQPVVDFETNTIWGAEALLRWKHPVLGVLPPKEFLGILETSGELYWLGLWNFEQLLINYKKLAETTKIFLSMNLSVQQLIHAELADDFRRIAKRHRIDESQICLEVVESVFVEKIEVVNNNIEKLKQSGFKIALDNYGQADSVGVFSNAQIDIVKLSRGYLNDTKENEMYKGIIKMLVELFKTNGNKIICEGVEDKEMFEYLKGLGLNLGQGYYFSHPIAFSDLAKIISTEQASE